MQQMRYLIKRNGEINFVMDSFFFFFSSLSVFLWLLYSDMYNIVDILLQIFILSYFIRKYEINLDTILIRINQRKFI